VKRCVGFASAVASLSKGDPSLVNYVSDFVESGCGLPKADSVIVNPGSTLSNDYSALSAARLALSRLFGSLSEDAPASLNVISAFCNWQSTLVARGAALLAVICARIAPASATGCGLARP
jgi:hypothetical protein